MAAVGTVTPQKAINERGQKLWSTKLVIPTGTTGTSKQSQDIGVNGELRLISIDAPNLVTDTSFTITLLDANGQIIGVTEEMADNNAHLTLTPGSFTTTGGSCIIPIFSDDHLLITFSTAQSGGSLDFKMVLRGVQ